MVLLSHAPRPTGDWAVPGPPTIATVQDYAGAWSDERARCHRLVYDPGGKPTGCPAPPVASGWRQDYQGRWYAVDACAGHASPLTRPRPTSVQPRS